MSDFFANIFWEIIISMSPTCRFEYMLNKQQRAGSKTVILYCILRKSDRKTDKIEIDTETETENY